MAASHTPGIPPKWSCFLNWLFPFSPPLLCKFFLLIQIGKFFNKLNMFSGDLGLVSNLNFPQTQAKCVPASSLSRFPCLCFAAKIFIYLFFVVPCGLWDLVPSRVLNLDANSTQLTVDNVYMHCQLGVVANPVRQTCHGTSRLAHYRSLLWLALPGQLLSHKLMPWWQAIWASGMTKTTPDGALRERSEWG